MSGRGDERPIRSETRTQVPESLESRLHRVARGDQLAFDTVYAQLVGPVFGMVRRILRDPAQAEEVAQEVMVELWRTAGRFDAERGSVQAWVMAMAHRQAVDCVRSTDVGSRREEFAAQHQHETPYDEVAEAVETRLDQQRVRRCLGSLTDLQRESVILAYYGGYTYPQVSKLLDVPLGTVKTRMRDGLTRLRDCLGAVG